MSLRQRLSELPAIAKEGIVDLLVLPQSVYFIEGSQSYSVRTITGINTVIIRILRKLKK